MMVELMLMPLPFALGIVHVAEDLEILTGASSPNSRLVQQIVPDSNHPQPAPRPVEIQSYAPVKKKTGTDLLRWYTPKIGRAHV